MNDKLNRFTQQLGDNAPLAPDLEKQSFVAATEVRGPATGLRVGVALCVVAALAVGLVVANRDSSPTAVVPANDLADEQSAAGEAIISKTVASVLPEGFNVSAVERTQEPTLNITAASPEGVVLLINAVLTASSDTDVTVPSITPVIDGTEIPTATMAPGSVRHQTVLTNPGDTIQNIADALSVSVNQLVEQYGWSDNYVFDSSVYIGWVDPSTASEDCFNKPCMRYLSNKITVESVATELGIAPQALAAYNGFGLDQPVAPNFPIVLPTVEETMSMVGATVGDVSVSTMPGSEIVDVADSDGLSITVQRFAFDDQALDESLSSKIHDALLALNDSEQSLQSLFDSITLKPSYATTAFFQESTTFQSLTLIHAGGYIDGSFSLLRFAASDGSSAKGLMTCLPATAIADSVSTNANGVIVAIKSNETSTCIVWLVDGQTVGATEVEVAALATEGLVQTNVPLGDIATAPTSEVTVPPSTDAPVNTAPGTEAPTEPPTSTTQTP